MDIFRAEKIGNQPLKICGTENALKSPLFGQLFWEKGGYKFSTLVDNVEKLFFEEVCFSTYAINAPVLAQSDNN